jgi:hypothetical protein
MSSDEALAYALSDEQDHAATDAVETPHAARDKEVLGLINADQPTSRLPKNSR